MAEKRMPVVFFGHGSPMIALEDNELTHNMKAIGDKVVAQFGKPKAILSVSAHWYTRQTFVQNAEKPEQIYDMYDFPDALYEVEYPASGSAELTQDVLDVLGADVTINDGWGIDHGTWVVLVHMYPDADIPVVQLSVNAHLDAQASYDLGKKLAVLRDRGYLIMGSGNIVHNLRRVEWDNPGGTKFAEEFSNYIVEGVLNHEDSRIVNWEEGPNPYYAVPTPDHYLPLAYCLGAADGDDATVFNNVCNLGALSMASFAWGMD